MIRETRKLLAALGAMNQQIPGVCLGIMDESLSVAKQAEFGELLVELGEAMQTHAQSQRVQLIEIKTETSDSPGSSSPGSQEHTE
jgi:hypothetical protein